MKQKQHQRKEMNDLDRKAINLNPPLYDKLLILALEYSVTVDLLIDIAVKRLIDDIELLRNLRAGKIDLE